MNGFLPIRNAIEGQISLAVFWITGLLALALLGPNTQQLMSYSNETLAKFSERMQAPNLKWAAVAGILFGAAVVSIIGQRPTEFLYFRF
jgi:hypothetical protein